MKNFVCGAILSVFCATVSAQAQTTATQDNSSFEMPAADWLLVQSAAQTSFNGKTLTLKGINPKTVMFADRPDRMTGSVDTQSFVGNWNQGKDSMEKDPPNATLSTIVDGKEVLSVVELTSPRLDGNTLSYSVRLLQGTPPNEGTMATLFIDWWMGPRGGICRHSAWGRVYCVPSYGRYPNPAYRN
ncbi:hypothetical protein ACFQU1_00090 [Chelatococcus sp. GCM10030263]|uniref:hypothetical protein n=1 Tax=Chelatococcus sp. GCM10030263 TaxID=3273387 RepID=UPI003618E1F6